MGGYENPLLFSLLSLISNNFSSHRSYKIKHICVVMWMRTLSYHWEKKEKAGKLKYRKRTNSLHTNLTKQIRQKNSNHYKPQIVKKKNQKSVAQTLDLTKKPQTVQTPVSPGNRVSLPLIEMYMLQYGQYGLRREQLVQRWEFFSARAAEA